MAEPKSEMSQETIPKEMAAAWSCTAGHKVRTLIVDGKVRVPTCDTCAAKGNKRRVEVGLLFDGQVDTNKKSVTAKSILDDGLGKRDAMWRLFCRMLDAGRVLMADGSRSNTKCTDCVNTSHDVPGCSCPCHEGWALRAQVEAEQKAA